jgi:hypothetical protein
MRIAAVHARRSEIPVPAHCEVVTWFPKVSPSA